MSVNEKSNSVRSLGRRLKKNQKRGLKPKPEDLNELQNFRISHQESLVKTFDFLSEKSKLYHKGFIAVFRLKRIDTILRKINRPNSTRLDSMYDIGGCRVIVDSYNQILKIVDEFEKSDEFEVEKHLDYFKNPQTTGYRSYHLIVKPKSCSKKVEVQLRTTAVHYWATFVEIIGLTFNVRLKEGMKHDELDRFNLLLSKEVKDLSFEDKQEIINIDQRLNILSKMYKLFKSNYYIAIKNWVTANENNKSSDYIIMEVEKSSYHPSFSFFANLKDAESIYFKRFDIEENTEMVLIKINKQTLKKLKLAYSNYILASHPFIKMYIDIYISILNRKDIEIRQFYSYSIYLYKLIKLFNSSLDEEFKNVESLFENHKNSIKEIREWLADLKERVKYFSEVRSKMENLNPPKLGFVQWIKNLFQFK
ncbi:MAG: hypothetical protein RJQ00_06820 [Vicingaceae bacterium]